MKENRLTIEEEKQLINFTGLQSMYDNGCPTSVIRPIMKQLTMLCNEYPEVADIMRNLIIDDMGIMLFNLVHDTEPGETIIKKFITNDFCYALQSWLMEQITYVEFHSYSGEACDAYNQWLETKELSGEISSLAGHNPYEQFATAFISYYCIKPTKFNTEMVEGMKEIIKQIRASKLVGGEINGK